MVNFKKYTYYMASQNSHLYSTFLALNNLLLSLSHPIFFNMIRQSIQVRAENSRSSPHTYVLGLNSLEDYVVQTFLLFIQNGTSKRCHQKPMTECLVGGIGGHFHKERMLLSTVECHFNVYTTQQVQ